MFIIFSLWMNAKVDKDKKKKWNEVNIQDR